MRQISTMDAGVPTMETPPPSPEIGQDNEDMISALPDDLLLGILDYLDFPVAVRAGAVSRRWRHLPHQLSWLDLDIVNFRGRGTTTLEIMDAFTDTLCRLLHPAECRRAAVDTLSSVSTCRPC